MKHVELIVEYLIRFSTIYLDRLLEASFFSKIALYVAISHVEKWRKVTQNNLLLNKQKAYLLHFMYFKLHFI